MANGNGDSSKAPIIAPPPGADLSKFAPQIDLTQFGLGQQTTQQSPDTAQTPKAYPAIASDPTGLGLPQFQASDEETAKRPLSFGMQVASADYVRQFDDYYRNGGDLSQIPMRDQIGVALYKDPDFFKKNPEAYYDHVFKPLEAQSKLEPGAQFNRAVMALPGMAWGVIKNAWDASMNAANQDADRMEFVFRKVTGMTHDQAYQDVLSRLGTENAAEAQGHAAAITTNADLILNTWGTLLNGGKPIAKLFAHTPEAKDQIDRAYSQYALDKAVIQSKLQDAGKALQTSYANAYKIVGQADIGQATQTATPNESAVAGYAMIKNPLNYLGLGEGAATVGAVRTSMFEKGLQAMEDVAGASAKKKALDITQIVPIQPEVSAAESAYIPVRNVQAQLAPAARQATQDLASAQDVLNSHLTTLDRISGDPGVITQLASNVLQLGGTGLQTLGKLTANINDVPGNFARWISGGNEIVKKVVQDAYEKVVFGTLLHHMGPIGGAIEVGLEHLPDVGHAFGSLLKTAGQELMYADNTIPFATRVAQQNKNLSKGLASFLDGPLVQTVVTLGKGAAAGTATGAAIGGLSGGIPGMVAGAAQGGIMSMAGAGLGQWVRYRNPNQYLLAARSDWKRYSDLLSPVERQHFSQLSPTNQVIIAQNAMKFPGLRIDYFNNANGPRGMHYVDQGGASHIQLNVANPQSALAGIFAHELTHAATHSGMITELYDTHLGNPLTGETGQFTLLGSDGKPVGIDPVTQRYYTDQKFQNYKNQYVNALAQSGVPTAHLNDFDISREIYAEHGADYILSGAPMLDANSAFRPGLYSKAALKNAMAQIGYTFSEDGKLIGAPNGTISGTGLFTDLQRNPDLMNIAQTFHKKGFQEGLMASEEQPTRTFTKRDLQNPNSTETWLNNASEFLRNPDGTAKRDPLTGLPIMRTKREYEQYNANFADSLRKGLESLPEDQRADLGFRKTETVNQKGQKAENIFTRYLPDTLLDTLAATNQYNPHQIASLRMLSRVLADKGNPGMEMRFFYRTATTPSKRYGSFAGNERLAVPYGFEIDSNNNVNIKSVDFNQLDNNYLKVRNREPFKSLWKDASDFTQDAHTYFTNHKEGRPGADAIGEAKRDVINALAGFGTEVHRTSNPLVDQMPGSVRPIIKSFAIDRSNQISATGAMRPFISEAQYYAMNRNYLPGAQEVSFLPARAAAPEADLRAPDSLRINTPERQAEVNQTQAKAQKWLDNNGVPDISTATYLTDQKQFPAGKLTNEGLGNFIRDNHEQLDISKPETRDRMADALTYDIMHALSKNGNAQGWYDDTVDRALNHIAANLDPSILKNPENELMFKLATAVTSQGQKVHPNFESGYKAFQYFKENGELPTDRSVFGGGVNAQAMEQNFAKINQLRKELGTDGLRDFLEKPMSVRELGTKFGVDVSGESKNSVLPGAAILGPKIGSFFGNLNKNFDSITMDLWLARTMHRMQGDMFGFSESAFRNQISDMRDRINNDEVNLPDAQKNRILRQIDTLDNVKEGSLTRERALRSGKAIADWAETTHDLFKRKDPVTGKTYSDRSDVNYLAKNIDQGLTKISDDPGGVADRQNIRDVFARTQQNLKDAGIHLTNADAQALIWYREQELFKKAGALQKGSENFDYLDAAHALVQKHARSALSAR
jgi:hypothetical protein